MEQILGVLSTNSCNPVAITVNISFPQILKIGVAPQKCTLREKILEL
jgi:hypothetical protein